MVVPCPLPFAATAQQKRDYVRWTPEEEAIFYGTLRDVAGQKPETCLKEATHRLGGSKDYPQAGGVWS